MSTVVDYAGRPSQPPPPPTAVHESVEQQRRENAKRILREAVSVQQPRHDWTKEEISAIYYQPLMELAYQAVSFFAVVSSIAVIVLLLLDIFRLHQLLAHDGCPIPLRCSPR